MKTCFTLLLVAVVLAVLLSDPTAEEVLRGSSAVFVVEEAAAQGADDKVERYTPAIKPGPRKWMVATAEAPPNSTILMVAYEPGGETLFRNISPVILDQKASAGVAKFPHQKSASRWPYQSAGDKAELFVLIFTAGAPETAKFRKHVAGLAEAIKKNKEDARLLYSAALKSEISNLIRRRSGQEIIARYPSTPIAGTTKEFTIPGSTQPVGPGGNSGKKRDAITYSTGKPGLLVYRVPPGS